MRNAGRWLLVLLALPLAFVAACGEVDDERLQLWAGSTAGYKKVDEFVQDTRNDRQLRLRALELLVVNQQELRVRTLVQKCADRDTLAPETADRIVALLESPDADVPFSAKEALFSLLPILPDGKKDAIQKAIAEWAFRGLSAVTDDVKVITHIEQHITIDQVALLGKHGADAALALLERGYGIEKTFYYLYGLNDPAVDQRALEAFRKLHATPEIDIPDHHLVKIQMLRTADAVVYLLALYMNEKLPSELRGDAFGLAIKGFQEPHVKAQGTRMLPGLYDVLNTAREDDRRLAAHYILRFGGVAELPKVLAAFRDDGGYNIDQYDTPRFLRDLCRDDVLKLRGDPVPPLLDALDNGTRISRTLALVCLKLSARVEVTPHLAKYVPDTTSLADILGPSMTTGLLAQNALDGLAAVTRITAERDEGKLAEDVYERLRGLYEDELGLTGPALDDAVQKRARDQVRKTADGEELP